MFKKTRHENTIKNLEQTKDRAKKIHKKYNKQNPSKNTDIDIANRETM